MTPRTSPRRLATLLVAAALAAASCSSSSDGDASDGTGGAASSAAGVTTSAPATSGPAQGDGPQIGVGGVDDWQTVAPDTVGLNTDILDEMAVDAEANGSNCLLVARDGKIAGEWYWNDGAVDKAQEVFSVTKSITSVLVGIAQDDGDLDIDEPAADFIPSWKNTDSSDVTVRDLLSNDSGREWTLASDYNALIFSPDKTDYAVGLGQDSPPGTTWAYNNSAIQTLSAVVGASTGEPYPEFGKERLLDPIGMADSALTPDGADDGLAFMGLQSTCRDLARFGELVRHDGAWNGEQIVSADYLDAATSAPSQDLNSAYGYLFWLNHTGVIAGATSPINAEQVAEAKDTRLVPDRPEDLIWALGLGGQTVQIHKASRTVVVRLGPGDLGTTYRNANTARVLDAIED